MSINTSVMANGLRVASDSMDTVETVSVGLWIEVGSRYESVEVNGVTHLLEHMAFKGTERRGARAIAEEIEAVGGHLNAYTTRESTAYYAKMLKDDLELAVDIIADIVQNSIFDPQELARERAVIIQEINQAQDTPDDVVFDNFQAGAYPNQALGRPVMGSVRLIRDLPREVIIEYMQDHYNAPGMILAAAGHVEHDQLLALAESAFSNLPSRGENSHPSSRYVGGESREEREIEQAHLLLGFEGVPLDRPDFYTLSVLSSLFGGGMSSRLFQEARENHGLVYNIYSFLSCYMDGGLFGIYANTGEKEAEALISLLCREIEKVQRDVTSEEVNRSRAQLKASILMSLESTFARCEQLARQIMVFGRPLPIAEIVEKVEAVDAAAVMQLAGRIFGGTLTQAALGPLSGVQRYDKITERLG